MCERAVDSGLSPGEPEHSTLSAPLLRHGTLAVRTGSQLVGRWPIAGGGLDWPHIVINLPCICEFHFVVSTIRKQLKGIKPLRIGNKCALIFMEV